MMADVDQIQIVVAHSERATLRVGDMFLKIDTDQARTDVEVQAMVMAPVPTPEILWRRPPVLALHGEGASRSRERDQRFEPRRTQRRTASMLTELSYACRVHTCIASPCDT